MKDKAKSLKLNEPHIAPLTHLVEEWKKELGSGTGMPYFDPLDGGINARLLWVLETPGPKAVGTNFVSRDNPDFTAKNTSRILEGAGIKRRDTVLWNVVPWNVSSKDKNQNPKAAEVQHGVPYLLRLLQQLPNLEAVILCGNHAKKAAYDIRESTSLRVFETYHPAPRSYNNPEYRNHIHKTLEQVAEFLNGSEANAMPVRLRASASTETNNLEGAHVRRASDVNKANPALVPVVYSVERHMGKTNEQCTEIFLELRKRILNLHPEVTEKAVKLLVGYKTINNFAEIHFLKNRLKIHLRPKSYIDPENRVEHLINPGFTMDRRLYISTAQDIDSVMLLIKQSYEDVASI